MKPYLSYSLILAAAASGMAFGAETAYTTPVGYVTHTLTQGQFNLTGVTLHRSTISAGVLDAESASPKSVTDTGVDFVALLGTPTPLSATPLTYILELADGTIQAVTDWTNLGVLKTPDDITSAVTPGTTTYKLRPASTITSLFGAQNSIGLTSSTDGDLTACDTVQIYNGAGFDVIYYFNNGLPGLDNVQGWFAENGDPAADYSVIYADSVYVKRVAGSPISFVNSGEMKKFATAGMLANGFNYVGAVAPVGLSLQASGLQNYLTQSPDGDFTVVDEVQIQVTGGGYRNCYYFNNGLPGLDNVQGWFDEAGDPAGDAVLDSGLLVLVRGAAKPYKISVPTGYSTL